MADTKLFYLQDKVRFRVGSIAKRCSLRSSLEGITESNIHRTRREKEIEHSFRVKLEL